MSTIAPRKAAAVGAGVAGAALGAVAARRLRHGPLVQSRRSLTVLAPREEIERRWAEPDVQRRIWDGREPSLRRIELREAGGDRGTVVALTASARGMSAGAAVRRFKSLLETGEIPTLEHNPSARDS